MLFRRRNVPVVVAPAPYAVPDTESLRRAALAASWQRDRVVGRRRIWRRWLQLWGGFVGLPVLSGLLLVVVALHPPRAVRATTGVDYAIFHGPTPEVQAHFGDAIHGMRLHWDAQLRYPAVATPAPSGADLSPSFPSPQLQSDDWLNSKEP